MRREIFPVELRSPTVRHARERGHPGWFVGGKAKKTGFPPSRLHGNDEIPETTVADSFNRRLGV